jgi:outer membrane protein assembly factor BamB
VGEKEEMILNGEFGLRAYDAKTGAELWHCKSFNGRGTPIPAYKESVLYVVNGKPGDVYAVKPGGKGDVTASHMLWHTARSKGRDLPSPVVLGQYLLVVGMRGTTNCYDRATGKELWEEKFRTSVSASPLVANGHCYLLCESGETIVIKLGATLKVVSRNKLPVEDREIFRSSMSASNGRIYIRSRSRLYCIE